MEERLQKFLANAGIASRRKCEELIKEGKIQVNGMTVTELGTKINPQKNNKRKFKQNIYFIKQTNRICNNSQRSI